MQRWDRQRAVICCTLFNVKIPSVVPQFYLNPFCSSDNWLSYHCRNRSRMTLILILQTVKPMLFPRYFVGSSLDPFFFHKVFKRELPHASGMSRLFQRFRVIRWMIWFMIGWLHVLSRYGAISLLALLFLSSFTWRSISSIVGGESSIWMFLEIFWSVWRNSGAFSRSSSCGVVNSDGTGGLKWALKWSTSFCGSHKWFTDLSVFPCCLALQFF